MRNKKKKTNDTQENQEIKKPKVKKRFFTNTDRRNVWLLIIMTILIIVGIFLFMPPNEKINQGLDIQGGLSVVLSAQTDSGEDITTEDMEKSKSIIESRVNALGASEATVQIQGDNQILVQIPGLQDSETALATIGKTGKLEFARADSFTDEDDIEAIENHTYAQTQTYSDDFGNTFQGDDITYRSVKSGTYTPLITGENITNVTVDRESETSSYYAVNITLDSEGTQAFADATRDLAPTNGQIVIILDNEIQSAPAVQTEITGGQVSITGNYTLEEAQSLQTVLESGSLPVSFHYEQSQIVGPTLGQDALLSGIIVALIGILVVICYLIFFYKGLGLITAFAMAVFGCLYLGILAGLSAFGLFSLTLSGIAGIVLTIGMAADSSILVLERFREEIRCGKSIKQASLTGVKHAILTSIDADLVTLVSALTLFFLASASVKGFGLTLALGICCDIVMMLLFKAPIIRLLAPHSIKHHPSFWGISDSIEAAKVYSELKEEEKDPTIVSQVKKSFSSLKGRFIKKDINFLGKKNILLIISACLIVVSVILVGVKGLDFGIEFVGGTSIQFYNTQDITTDNMRAAFDEIGDNEAVIQTTQTDGQDGFLVRTSQTSPEEATNEALSVAKSLGISESNFEVNTVGPDWGQGVIQASIIAFVVSLLLIICYIAIRFEYRMGIIAVVALIHDLIIVVGVYALFGREITPNTVAALLTILGYSLYDTVVVFHRINDNMKDAQNNCTFMSMANHSLNQVFIRTINTTLTSFIPVLAMLLFGSETLKDFAFAMAIGLIAGSYSSIAVATPLFSMWKSKNKKNERLTKKYGKAIEIFTFANTPLACLETTTATVVANERIASTNNSQKSQRDTYLSGKTSSPSQNKSPSQKNSKNATKPSNSPNTQTKIRYRRKKK